MGIEQDKPAVIKIIGVGGGGCNAVTRMISEGLTGVEVLAINTDAQALRQCLAPVQISLSTGQSQALGAGGDPTLAAEAALQHRVVIQDAIKGANMVFVAAGMGGGTGTGAAPVVASISKELGILTVAVVTMPFQFEGGDRMAVAIEGLRELASKVDTVIVIDNQRLFTLFRDTRVTDAFRLVDQVLFNSVQAITDIVTRVGEINRDFKDVEAVLRGAGSAIIGQGEAEGEGAAVKAVEIALQSPLVSSTLQSPSRILFAVQAADTLTVEELDAASHYLANYAADRHTLFFGLLTDPEMGDRVKVTVLAAGFTDHPNTAVAGERPAGYATAPNAAGATNGRQAPVHAVVARTSASDTVAGTLYDPATPLGGMEVPPITIPAPLNSQQGGTSQLGVPLDLPMPTNIDPNDVEQPAFFRRGR